MDIKQLCEELRSLLLLQLAELPPNYTWHAINISDFFELLLLLNQPKTNEQLNSENIKPFIQYLAKRWHKIRHTDLAYFQAPKEILNTICILLADRLQDVTKTSRYLLLMPTIKKSDNEISGLDLNEKNLAVHEIILSDDDDYFIDVAATLDFACEDGVLKHTQLFDGQVKPLTTDEARRVITHSKEARELYIATINRLRVVSAGSSFGAMLTRLVKALMRGGTKSRGGTEFDCGHNANEGIASFYVWLETLENEDRQKLYSAKSDSLTDKTFKSIWGRLAHDKNLDYQNTLTCVEINAGNIQKIIDDNKWLFDYYPKQCTNTKAVAVKVLDEELRHAKDNLTKAIRSDNYTVTSSYGLAGRLRLYHQTLHNDDLIPALSLQAVPGLSINTMINLQQQLLKSIALTSYSSRENTLDILCNIFEKVNSFSLSTLTFPDLIEILHHLPSQVRAIFLDKIFTKPTTLVSNSKDLLLLSQYIPPEQQLPFIAYFDDLIAKEILTNSGSALMLLSICNEDNRFLILENWIDQHYTLIRNIMTQLIILLPALDKNWIVTTHLALFSEAVKDVDDISHVAEALLYPNFDEDGKAITYEQEKKKLLTTDLFKNILASSSKIVVVPEAIIAQINAFIFTLKPRLSSIIKDADDYHKLCNILPNDALIKELRQQFPQYQEPYFGLSDEAMQERLLEMRAQLYREHPQSYGGRFAMFFNPASWFERQNTTRDRNDRCTIM